MRRSNALNQYLISTLLFLLVWHCHGHEHHNHIDPVTAKYAQPAASIDPLSKPTDSPHTQQHHEDEHIHETIEARLRTKHDLRKSVRQHDDHDDGKHESEQDYIDRLNAPLENEYNKEHQFQYTPPPLADNTNATESQNQSGDNLQIPIPPIQNDTQTVSSSTPSPVPTETLEHTRHQQASAEHIPIAVQEHLLKTILEPPKPTVASPASGQPPAEATEQKNIIKEDILFIHKETISSTQPHQEEQRNHVVKLFTDPPTPATHQQAIPAPEVTMNNTAQENRSLDVQPAVPTPSSEPQNVSESVQNITSPDPVATKPAPESPLVNITQDNATMQNNTLPNTETTAAQQIPPGDNVTESLKPPVAQQIPSADQGIESLKPSVVETKKVEDPKPLPRTFVTPTTTPTPPRVLRSATSRIQQKVQTRQRHARSEDEPVKVAQEAENATIESATMPTMDSVTPMPTAAVPSVESATISTPPIEPIVEVPSSLKPEEPHVETAQQPVEDSDEETTVDTSDLPRQVHVHRHPSTLDERDETVNKVDSLPVEIENSTVSHDFLGHDHSPHLPRILENEEKAPDAETLHTTLPTMDAHVHSDHHHLEPKIDEGISANQSNHSDSSTPTKYRQLCWRLPKTFEPSLQLVDHHVLQLINFLPEYIQTLVFGPLDNPEIMLNTIWFGSVCTMCFLFSLLFLSMGTKRLKQSKDEKAIRARCQQLQQFNNQLELERATFERQNQKLSDEVDELKTLPVRDADEDLFELREKYDRIQADLKQVRAERDALHQDNDYKQSLMQKHEFELQKQAETVAHLNDEILQQKQQLDKERGTIARIQSNDLTLERFEALRETIHELKSEITQVKQEKFAQTDHLKEIQERSNQLDVENNQLTVKMKQLKDLLEQREETITRLREKMANDNDDENTGSDNLSDGNNEDNERFLLAIDNDVEKANQHMRQLHSDIEEKARRIKELDTLLNQEKDRCREFETKLKVILELRERDAHLHIRQLGQSDAELRKARTDTERVRILQQQLELKQQQLDDVQKVLATDQTKFSEECSKLQHETHEKWMEVKRLTRELDAARKECEGLRRQITKYAHNERSSQEKTMLKPVPQHMNNTGGRGSSEPETNGSSPPVPYQQGDNFRPIDHQRNDSGAASPADMFRPRPPPMFGMHRPPFFPPPFMGSVPPNPFMMGPRFGMPMGGPHGMISPIAHLTTNGSVGGSDANSFEIVDSTNITPNSTSYDAPLNGSAASPIPGNDQHAKAKKPKKSLKKKTKTPTTTPKTMAPSSKEDV